MELKEVTVVAKRTPDEAFWKTRTSVRFIGRESLHSEALIPDDDFASVFSTMLSEVERKVIEAVGRPDEL